MNMRSDAATQKWADPEIRKRIIDGQRAYWKRAGIRKQRGKIAKNALAAPEVRQRISEGTKNAYKNPEVKDRLRKGLQGTWKRHPERREQASETAKRVFGDPEVEQRRQQGHARPETREKISQGGKRAWKNNEKRRRQVSEWAKKLWAERRATPTQKPGRRGRRRGQILEDTAARITVVADCMLRGIKPYQIAQHAYPLHRRKNDAYKAYEQLLLLHEAAIEQRKSYLSELCELDRKAIIEQATNSLISAIRHSTSGQDVRRLR